MANKALIKWGWVRGIVGILAGYLVVDNSWYVLRLIKLLFDIKIDRLVSVTNSLIFTLLVVYLFRRFVDRRSFISLGFSIKGYARAILLGLSGSFVLMGAGFLILYALGDVTITSFNPDVGSLLYWAIGLLFAAALEEIPFRGYMLINMLESMNRYIAVGIISVIFGLLHATGQYMSVVGIVNCTLLGVLIGLYYIHKRNLWVPIVFHMGWNFFQGTIFGFGVSGKSFEYSLLETEISGSDLITGGNVGFEGSLVLTFLTVVSIIFFEMRWRRFDGEAADAAAGNLE